jgi:hypothetical protein
MLSPAIAIAAKQKNNLIPLPLPRGGLGIRSQSESGKYLEIEMRIKICSDNSSKINAAIIAINGKPLAHTADYSDINELAMAMQNQLTDLSIAKKDQIGATASGMSGGNVPAAYKYSRILNTFEIERGASNWFLVNVKRIENYGNASKSRLSLTPAQRDIAIAKFTATFSVQTVVALAVAA